MPAGKVHAIGKGVLLAEIQQTSDITYRLYDFDRVDAKGNKRDLHIDLALDAINYNRVKAQKAYSKIENTSNEMVDCKYFTTNFIPLKGSVAVQNNGTSFTVYMCTEGEFTLAVDNAVYTYR
ncbi:MAG TPA: mannose-6-phosphate isomerase, partial [Bacteroidales bacterium]|nr:mannose-6-phosphate isomerase [Bacteroidales bacterium]